MRHLHWFSCSTALTMAAACAGAAPCNPPPPKQAVERLQGYLSYEAAWESGTYGVKEFDAAVLLGGVLFRSQERSQLPPGRIVYVIPEGRRISSMSCPEAEDWVGCVVRGMPQEFPSGSASAACSTQIDVPTWRASAATPAKKRLAAELVQELMSGAGYSDPKAIYVRDFNMDDPELLFYIVDAEGKDNLQGCHFDASQHPHCGWHLFGQAPVEKLKRDVMARPYKLFP